MMEPTAVTLKDPTFTVEHLRGMDWALRYLRTSPRLHKPQLEVLDNLIAEVRHRWKELQDATDAAGEALSDPVCSCGHPRSEHMMEWSRVCLGIDADTNSPCSRCEEYSYTNDTLSAETAEKEKMPK